MERNHLSPLRSAPPRPALCPLPPGQTSFGAACTGSVIYERACPLPFPSQPLRTWSAHKRATSLQIYFPLRSGRLDARRAQDVRLNLSRHRRNVYEIVSVIPKVYCWESSPCSISGKYLIFGLSRLGGVDSRFLSTYSGSLSTCIFSRHG